MKTTIIKENKQLIKENLSESEADKLKGFGKRNTLKLIRSLTKAYNLMCPHCKKLLIQNPKRDITDYCLLCQELLEDRVIKFINKK